MTRYKSPHISALVLAWIIACLALPPVALATDGADGTSGQAMLDADTGQLFDSQDPPHTLITPRNTTKTHTGHGTATLTDSDICTTGTQTGAPPCLDSNGQISSAVATDFVKTTDTRLTNARDWTGSGTLTNYTPLTDTRLTNARASNDTVKATNGLVLTTGTSTVTASSAVVSNTVVFSGQNFVQTTDTRLTNGRDWTNSTTLTNYTPLTDTRLTNGRDWTNSTTLTNYLPTTDPSVTNARTPTGSVYASTGIGFLTGTSTVTVTSAALSASPTVVNTSAGSWTGSGVLTAYTQNTDTRLTNGRDWTNSTTLTNYTPLTDTRLTDARTPVGSVYAGAGVGFLTGTSTTTVSVAALSASPTVVATSAGSWTGSDTLTNYVQTTDTRLTNGRDWTNSTTLTNYVQGTDTRLTNARKSSDTVKATNGLVLTTGTSTVTASSAVVSNTVVFSGQNFVQTTDTQLTNGRDWTNSTTLTNYTPLTDTRLTNGRDWTNSTTLTNYTPLTDTRLTNGRASTNTLYGTAGVVFQTDSTTNTYTTAAVSANPTVSITGLSVGGVPSDGSLYFLPDASDLAGKSVITTDVGTQTYTYTAYGTVTSSYTQSYTYTSSFTSSVTVTNTATSSFTYSQTSTSSHTVTATSTYYCKVATASDITVTGLVIATVTGTIDYVNSQTKTHTETVQRWVQQTGTLTGTTITFTATDTNAQTGTGTGTASSSMTGIVAPSTTTLTATALVSANVTTGSMTMTASTATSTHHATVTGTYTHTISTTSTCTGSMAGGGTATVTQTDTATLTGWSITVTNTGTNTLTSTNTITNTSYQMVGSPQCVSTTNAGEVLMGEYVTPLGYPGRNAWAAGNWTLNLWRYVDNAAGATGIHGYVYVRSAAGVNSLFYTFDTGDINDTATTLQVMQTSLAAMLEHGDDRIDMKLYAYTDQASARQVCFSRGGSDGTAISSMQTPAQNGNIGSNGNYIYAGDGIGLRTSTATGTASNTVTTAAISTNPTIINTSTQTANMNGTLTAGYVPVATGPQSLGNSIISQNATGVSIGSVGAPTAKFSIGSYQLFNVDDSGNVYANAYNGHGLTPLGGSGSVGKIPYLDSNGLGDVFVTHGYYTGWGPTGTSTVTATTATVDISTMTVPEDYNSDSSLLVTAQVNLIADTNGAICTLGLNIVSTTGGETCGGGITCTGNFGAGTLQVQGQIGQTFTYVNATLVGTASQTIARAYTVTVYMSSTNGTCRASPGASHLVVQRVPRN